MTKIARLRTTLAGHPGITARRQEGQRPAIHVMHLSNSDCHIKCQVNAGHPSDTAHSVQGQRPVIQGAHLSNSD